MAELAAVTADRPLDPEQRDAHQDERDEIRDEEGAAAVLGGLSGEAEEVAETDGVARHRQHEPDARAPALFSGHALAAGAPPWDARDARR